MFQISIDAFLANDIELSEVKKVAKYLANTLHTSILVYTSTKTLEVKEDEEEKEKDVEKPEESQEKS